MVFSAENVGRTHMSPDKSSPALQLKVGLIIPACRGH